jgi:hypothetical protein
VVAPEKLVPAPKNGEDEDVEPTPPPEATPTPTPTPAPLPAASYRAQLNNGWDLWITDSLPPQDRLGTFLAAVRDGWLRLRGLGQEHAPAITLAMTDDDARRIHHLVQGGLAILVANEM